MITWQRRRYGEHFGTGHLRHSYRIAPWGEGWVLSRACDGVWRSLPGIYVSVREAKAAAVVLEISAPAAAGVGE
jgi:hypothetical protein